ncbi:LacI family transcriptional regulator [Halolactibacillus alkaliphilus]|uniref:Catabolite control protein A n=1 Tax=Halolactibacillus alkaliphilus TaxID=442899 RepID=A0A511X3D1_9BACI|nr:LacI family DNA-binding transcriptional regulator [Halolactibacillus alkaliphilus]GEN57459.1 LacI family transcriptional regulator [Halolactibacillus alkaliphilus]GGN68355.1 LacI family transcriptional regulator [Halolactibacillus alkaliphilus]SFO95362.1 transcriptional regulator, LacI family [Halolactibacillus alkaliphilus]
MATIKEVAKLAGVSVATVSRVLNNQGYVHLDTRGKVEKAIKQLNYTPNAVARSLFKKASNTIALIIPDIANPYFPQLVKWIEKELTEAGYDLLLFNSNNDIDKELRLLYLLEAKYIDGLLLVSNYLTKEDVKKVTLPIVALDQFLDEEIPSVTVDNYQGAKEAVRHLIDSGCQSIGHIVGPQDSYTSKHRLRGYLDVMEEQNKTPRIVEGEYDLTTAMEQTALLLEQYPDIDGIFAGNDVMGIGAIKVIQSLGLNVPEDIAVIGFDGIDWGTVITPELTTMAQPIQSLAQAATQLVLDLIKKKETNTHYQYKATLEKRQSTH